jgi:Protein of unknown function (DUF2786)
MTDKNDTAREAILSRIRALMAKTVANGCTEAEADAAAAAVDRLMALYEIDLTEATVQEQDVMRMDIALNGHPARWAATKVAAFTDCKVWTDKGFISFLGLEIDTQIAEYLMLLFQRAIDRETMNFGAFNADLAMEDHHGRQNMITSFQAGMAGRLGERLADMKSKRDFTQRKSGFDLVLSKKALVDEAWTSLGITLSAGKGGGVTIRHQGAYNAGRSAADGVSINQGVTGRSGGSGRIK